MSVRLLNEMITSLRRKNCPSAPIILVGTQIDRRGLFASYKRPHDSPAGVLAGSQPALRGSKVNILTSQMGRKHGSIFFIIRRGEGGC